MIGKVKFTDRFVITKRFYILPMFNTQATYHLAVDVDGPKLTPVKATWLRFLRFAVVVSYKEIVNESN